jgi:3-hydroxy-9,10-secoandrosta-1,3,5(10)-triene-9,17-dione monooxygenase reductase component
VESVSQVPEGMREDAHQTWPSHDLIESWLGDSMYDFQFRPGEDTFVDADDPEAIAAARRFRDVLGRFASGVTVITAISGGAPVGLTCQSFSSVWMITRLLLFILSKYLV